MSIAHSVLAHRAQRFVAPSDLLRLALWPIAPSDLPSDLRPAFWPIAPSDHFTPEGPHSRRVGLGGPRRDTPCLPATRANRSARAVVGL